MLLVLWSMLPGCRPDAGIDTAPAFHLDLVPIAAENQSPFDDVDQIDLVVGVQGDAPQTLSLDAPGSGGSVTTGQIAPLEGDVIEVRESSRGIQKIVDALSKVDRTSRPTWIELDKDNMRGKVTALPARSDIAADIDEQLIVELYSK